MVLTPWNGGKWLTGGGRGPGGCLTLNKWMWKMEQILVSEAEIFLGWNFANVRNPHDSKNPKREQNVQFESTLPVLQTCLMLYFFFLWNGVRLSEICPLDLKKGKYPPQWGTMWLFCEFPFATNSSRCSDVIRLLRHSEKAIKGHVNKNRIIYKCVLKFLSDFLTFCDKNGTSALAEMKKKKAEARF